MPAADVLLTKAILHDWDDAHGARILARCRQALAGGGFAIASIQPLVLDLGLIDCRLA